MKLNKFEYWTTVILVALFVPQLKAAARSSSNFFGTFLNEGKVRVEVDIVGRDGRDGVTIPLEPGHIEKTSIPPGQTKLYLPSRGGEERRLLWSGTTPTPMSAVTFFAQKTRMFYFRIIGNKIVLVRPKDLTGAERAKIKWYDEILRRDAEGR